MVVGCEVKTEHGFLLKCISRLLSKPGVAAKHEKQDETVKWEKKPVYILVFKVLEGPKKELNNFQFKYFENGLPVKQNDLGKIIIE